MSYTQFLASIRWNSLEALIYQALLIANQALLFYILDSSAYGLVGILFSLVYLVVAITNMGLDLSLGPLFSSLNRDQITVKRILLPHLLLQPCIITLVIIGGLILYITGSTHLIPNSHSLSSALYVILTLLMYTESIKKTLRVLLHLIFLSRITALLEIATIALYVGFITLSYLLGWQLTPIAIFAPLLILSSIGTAILSIVAYRWYATLPKKNGVYYNELNHRMIKNRMWNYGIQLGHALFSGNFLISLFGIQFGLAQAGVAKFANSIAHGIATIARKIFDTTSGSYLSHVKEQDTHSKHAVFATISTHINQLLYSIILGMCIIGPRLWQLQTTASIQASILIILLGAVHIFELFYMAYEKFFINEEKSLYLIISYGIPTALVGMVYWLSPSLSIYALLIILLLARILTFIILSTLSLFLWNLRPTLHAKPKYLAYSLLASLTILFFIS